VAKISSVECKLSLDHVRADERNPVLGHFGVSNITKVSAILPVQVSASHLKVAREIHLKSRKHAIVVPMGQSRTVGGVSVAKGLIDLSI